jgi:glycolate dehydrogenase iron-sulfur subunit
MHVELADSMHHDARAQQAKDLISACVHCGFCLATCPTYLDGADERDSPRGRIYLVKQLLETGAASEQTRTHLDRCLTCRSCETTCPSGMQYGHLLDLSRPMIEEAAPRPAGPRLLRRLLRESLSRPALFGFGLKIGQWLRPLLPRSLKRQIPHRQQLSPPLPVSTSRTMLVLDGCVQASATPRTNNAAGRVLAKLGIQLLSAPSAGCCGAVNHHLGAAEAGLDNMRRNIDAWWPLVEAGAEAMISSATGCGAMLADYGHLLRDDPQYAEKAARISAMHRDIAQLLQDENLEALTPDTAVGKVAVHTPCSQQHALRQTGQVQDLLSRAGFQLAATRDDHLCCGSAGTYSILQSATSQRLRERKLAALTGDTPDLIVTANVGCQLHLADDTGPPVCHWLELLDPQ